MRHWSNIVLALAFLAGGWSGALAGALCPHESCAAATSRARHSRPAAGTAAAETSDECHATSQGDAAGGGHDGHASRADATSRGGGAHDTAHQAFAHDGGDAGGNRVKVVSLPTASLSAGETSCAHCVGRPEAPRSAATEGRAEHPKRQGCAEAAPAVSARAIPAWAGAREVIPSRRGPPGKVSQHLLNSVFRI